VLYKVFKQTRTVVFVPGNHPKESIQHSGHGESLKSRIEQWFFLCVHAHFLPPSFWAPVAQGKYYIRYILPSGAVLKGLFFSYVACLV